MLDALASVSTGEVTRSGRDASIDGVAVRVGEWLGIVDDRAVVSGSDFETVAEAVIDRTLAGGQELLTLVTGDEELDVASLVRRVGDRHPGVEVSEHAGGQPHYPLLVLAG